MDRRAKVAALTALGALTLGLLVYMLSRSQRKGDGDQSSNGDGGAGTISADRGAKAGSEGGVSEAQPEGAVKEGQAEGVKGAKGDSVTREEERKEFVARFNQANSLAKKYFKGGRYEQAAEQYGIALDLCDHLPNHEEKRIALYNNRGAAFEKARKYAQALAECVRCLSKDPAHNLARVRKSRVLEALGQPTEALAEVCAHLLLERDRVQAKALENPSQPLTPPPPPANLESLLQKVATARADKIMDERAAAEAEESGTSGGGDEGAGVAKRKPKPLPRQAVLELCRSFGTFAQLELDYKGVDEATYTRQLEEQAASAGEGSLASVVRVSMLLDRCRLRLVKRDFEGGREDVYEAAEHLATLESQAGEEGAGIPFAVEMAVWEWQGTFLQIETQLDQAMVAYEKCCGAADKEGFHVPTDILIKIAWVYMDKENTATAETYFTRAIEADPEYGSSYAHRARLHADTEGLEGVKGYLDKALAANPKDMFAWEQLARLYVNAEDFDKALKAIDDGLKAVPKSESLLTLKAEVKYTLATRNGDSSSGAEILGLFNEAIKADPNSMVVYVNKAMFVLQMMQDVPGATSLLEKAVEVDPTCVTAMLQLANLKIMVAKSLDDARAAATLLQQAVDACTGRDELIETMSVLVATEARIKGALLLGRSSLC